MVNFKKMDDKDFVFINRPLTKKEEQAFSELLKGRKKKTKSGVKDKPKQKSGSAQDGTTNNIGVMQ